MSQPTGQDYYEAFELEKQRGNACLYQLERLESVSFGAHSTLTDKEIQLGGMKSVIKLFQMQEWIPAAKGWQAERRNIVAWQINVNLGEIQPCN